MKIFGLIGNPLGHSFSASFFNAWFEAEGIDAVYKNFPLPSIDCLPALISASPNLAALNVTYPYKESVISFLDNLHGDARIVNAANVIVIERGARLRLCGYNTDVGGFKADIVKFLKPMSISGALILGSGGASKAVDCALRQLGVPALIVSRTPVADRIAYSDISASLLREYPLIVNATPLGMGALRDSAPDIPYHLLNRRNLCYDLIYNPSPTLFLKRCAASGARCRGGLQMLINQALLASRLFLG